MTDPLLIIAVLCVNVVVSEILIRRTFLRHFGTALLVILVTAIASNAGIIPANTTDAPIYDAIFKYVAPLAIFWLLLQINLRSVLRAGGPMLFMFLIGSAGTFAGVLLAMWLLNGKENIGELHNALAGMFVGTYTGGSVNFNAVALEYEVTKDGMLYAGSMAVDNILTTIWMVITIAAPRVISRLTPRRSAQAKPQGVVITGVEDDTESVHPLDFALIIALGLVALWGSEFLADWLKANMGRDVPSIVILTTIALVLAQLPVMRRIKGAKSLGMFAVYIFLAVIGALCDASALQGIGRLGPILLALVTITVAVHGVTVFGAAWIFKIDPDIAAVASQANIGGSTSAIALARSLGRADLVLPGVLVGSLGYALGTYLGFLTASMLG